MSWRVNGREYHRYADYEAALARSRSKQIERLLEQIRVAPVNDGGAASQLALAEARRGRLRRALADLAAGAAGLPKEGRELSAAVRRRFEALSREGEAARGRLAAAAEGLDGLLQDLQERERRAVRQLDADLGAELAHDTHRDADAAQRAAHHLTEAAAAVSRAEALDLGRLGLRSPRSAVESAQRESGPGGLAAAVNARRRASGLAAEADGRDARLRAERMVRGEELDELLEQLDGIAQQGWLVGEGKSALHQPLVAAADRLRSRNQTLPAWDDRAGWYRSLDESIAALRRRTTALSTQVEDFESLDETRHQLVANELAPRLERLLGERLRQTEVRPGARPIDPVEVRYRTAQGERIDCTVDLDGSLRIHHHGHADHATCAEAARRMARGLPEFMRSDGPTLDAQTPRGQR